MNKLNKRSISAVIFTRLVLIAGMANAHDIDEAGMPVCIEGNYMMADAMNAPFGEQDPGRVIEMNITKYGLFRERGKG